MHLATLGALSEIIFGLAPTLAVSMRGLPRPKMRWDIWLFLNSGIVLLLIGIPAMTRSLIITGGTLAGIAAILLIEQLIDRLPSKHLKKLQVWKEANSTSPGWVIW